MKIFGVYIFATEEEKLEQLFEEMMEEVFDTFDEKSQEELRAAGNAPPRDRTRRRTED